jgi:hypothetical protein
VELKENLLPKKVEPLKKVAKEEELKKPLAKERQNE